METLESELSHKKKEMSSMLSKDTMDIMQNDIDRLKVYFKENPPLPVGSPVPDSTIIDYKGNKVDFHKVLGNKPAIVVFYRGSWCPYCNLELMAYEKLLSEKENEGVAMYAISPEKRDITIKSLDIEKLPFDVFSDIDNELAKKFKIVFTLPDNVNKLYIELGINLDESQGNHKKELPIPATYVIDANGIIVKEWCNPDYSVRAEPSEVIAEYKKV